MLIEDDAEDVHIIRYTLEDLPYSVSLQVAESGKEAVKYLQNSQNTRPDLIICDMHVGADTGVEIWKNIKGAGLETARHIPFIFLTTGVVDRVVEDAYAIPSHGVFLKQTSLDDCVAQMKAILAYWTFALVPEQSIII